MTNNGPDFICIGAQKAGTSWLYWNLYWHPQTDMPPEKEMNYFFPCPNRLRMWIEGDDYEGETGEWPLYFAKWQKARRAEDRQFAYAWYLRYLFLPRTVGNYRRLFRRSRNKVAGDISPHYACMTEEYVRKMAKAAPKAKIIYLLRDPVERSWSEFRMRHPQLLRGASDQQLEALKAMDLKFSRYSQAIDLWSRYFPGRVRVWFHEQIAQEPEVLFGEVCDFIGLPPLLNFANQKLRERVYEGPMSEMGQDARRYLSTQLLAEIETLHNHFQNEYTQRWLTNARAGLAAEASQALSIAG